MKGKKKMNAIETVKLTRRFGDLTAVNALDLTIPEGELFALLGVNGAGKTTAIRMLCGLLPPTSGDALLLGHSITRDAAAAKALLNVSPQETAVAGSLTVRENLAFIAGIYGMNRRAAGEAADASIERMGLQSVAKRRAKQLSGGWQRRLSIAMGLITNPKILFMDEPTLGLDVLAKRDLIQGLKQINRDKGVTLLVTSHDMDDLRDMARRLVLLHEGRIRYDGDFDGLLNHADKRDFESIIAKMYEEWLPENP